MRLLKLLLDENVNPVCGLELMRREPAAVVWRVGDPGAPPKGTLDPDLLAWCEEWEFVIVTNNRASMPRHLADNLTQDRHSPGIVVLNPNLSVRETVDDLWLLVMVSGAEVLRDRILHLPL